jgi:acetyl-CoA carboxylase biotin carboxylase subunit
MAIRRIFVANRGEIAVRIIRTCRELGLESVLGVSEADRDSLGAKLATRSVCIGPAPSARSYLHIPAIIEAALRTGCDALHPGYGFLAESPALAEACAENDLIFIGPTAAQIHAVGDKSRARQHAGEAGVPIVPGYDAATIDDAIWVADEIGFPLLIKAVAGGGGRGMKLVRRAEELEAAFDMAMAEAGAAFGDGRLYMERFIESGRHIEVQILGDGENIVHLGERDCSVQRRYQKVVEEAPAPGLSPSLRALIHGAALRFCERLGYRSLGTVEFLVDTASTEYYFLEMNARIQVEHPVTEAVLGLDLVAEQIRIANGEPLRFRQSDIRPRGHAIECRINAESPDFRPCPGTVTEFWIPAANGVRVDTHIRPGARVPPYYDSMIAKVVAWGDDRPRAIAALRGALRAALVEGIACNIALHRAILDDAMFQLGGVDTLWLGEFLQMSKERADA